MGTHVIKTGMLLGCDVDQIGYLGMDVQPEDFYLSEHFQLKEFRAKNGNDIVFFSSRIVNVLEELHKRVNERSKVYVPVILNSAFRPPQYSQDVGGYDDDNHVFGLAVDVRTPSGYTPEMLAKELESICGHFCGIGIYSWGCHIDVRNGHGRWKG